MQRLLLRLAGRPRLACGVLWLAEQGTVQEFYGVRMVKGVPAQCLKEQALVQARCCELTVLEVSRRR